MTLQTWRNTLLIKNDILTKHFKNLNRRSTITTWVYKPTGTRDGQDTADGPHLIQKG